MKIQILLCFVLVHTCSAAVIWSCQNWVSGNILGGCNWGTTNIHHGESDLRVVSDPSGGSSNNALRVFYKKGSHAGTSPKGGTQWLGRPFTGQDTARLEYEVYFASSFSFVKGGKLPGFYGGTGTCSGGTGQTTCFSLRFMWRANGDGEIYGYIPNETGNWFCNNPDVFCNFNNGHSFGRGSFKFSKGKWHTINEYVKLNTPGTANGIMRVTFDGRQVYEITGLNFRNSNSIKIDGVYFSTFFGGSDDSWASASDTYTYFRNFKVHV